MSASKPAFTVIDKRGQNHEEPKPAPLEEKTHEGMTWVNVAHQVVFPVVGQDQHGHPIHAAFYQCTGKRSDGRPFISLYMFGPWITAGEDPKKEALRRLNTFLNCACTDTGPCGAHRLSMPEWERDDQMRVQRQNTLPMPEAMELVVRMQQARQSRLVVPAR